MSGHEDLKKEITIWQRRLQKRKEQKALYGASADPSVDIEIEDIQRKLEQLYSELTQLNDVIETDTDRKFIQGMKLIISDDNKDRIKAAKLFTQMKEVDAIPLLEMQLLKGQTPLVGYRMAIAIGKIGGPQAIASLETLLQQLTDKIDVYTLEGLKDALETAKNS